MKKSSFWIIRAALAVQFFGALAVPALVAADQSPRGIWVAEWLRPRTGRALSERSASRGEGEREANGRTIGVLKVRDGKLSFVEQTGEASWEVALTSVKRVSIVNRAVVVEATEGAYVIAIMDGNFMQGSPKKAVDLIENAIDANATEWSGLSDGRRNRR
jgi:hypothetical protein